MAVEGYKKSIMKRQNGLETHLKVRCGEPCCYTVKTSRKAKCDYRAWNLANSMYV